MAEEMTLTAFFYFVLLILIVTPRCSSEVTMCNVTVPDRYLDNQASLARCYTFPPPDHVVCYYLVDWTWIKKLPPTVTNLIIKESHLFEVPSNTFLHLPNITDLAIENSHLICAQPCAFCGLPLLKNLSLFSNFIQPAQYSSFTESLIDKNLTYLYLDYQHNFGQEVRLTEKSLRAFEQLEIKFLSLIQNTFQIENTEFMGLKHLSRIRCLVLAYNKFTLDLNSAKTMTPLVIGITNMKSLTLFDIGKQVLNSGDHFDFQLRKLRFQQCNQAVLDYANDTCTPQHVDIHSLPVNLRSITRIFSLMPSKLMRLYTDQTYYRIEAKRGQTTVLQNSSVSVIDVSRFAESFFCLPPKLLLGLDCMREIYNKYCDLIDIYEESFSYLPRLEVVDYSYGRIDPLGNMTSREIFRNNTKLRKIALRKCGITCEMINRHDSFITVNSLEELDLSDNDGLNCFPVKLLSHVPKLRFFNMSGHFATWFDQRSMKYIDQTLKVLNKSGKGFKLDIEGANFQCICEPESLSFITWFKARLPMFPSNMNASCFLPNSTGVMIKDLDLNALSEYCQSLLPLPDKSPNVAMYTTSAISGIVFLIICIVIVVQRDKLCYDCLMLLVRCRKSQASLIEMENLLEDGSVTGYVMLVYHPDDGAVTRDIRVALAQESCPVFDIETGLTLRWDTESGPVMSQEAWYLAGGFPYEVFTRGLAGASTIVIVTSPAAIRNDWFCFSVRMITEHIAVKRYLPVVLIRPEEHQVQDVFRWRKLVSLRKRKQVKEFVIKKEDGSTENAADNTRVIKRVISMCDSYDS